MVERPDLSGRSRVVRTKMYCTYILISEKSGRYYVGHSNDLDERLKTHNTGKVKSTRNKGPWKCVYFEEFQTKLDANEGN